MAFSYDHFPSLLDSAYLPSSPVETPLLPQQTGDHTPLNATSYCFPCYYSSETIAEFSGTDAKVYDSSSSLDSATDAPSADSSSGYSPKIGDIEKHKHSSKPQVFVEKKRKPKDGNPSFMSSHSKIAKGSKSCKQDKTNVGLKGRESKKAKADNLKPSGEPPSGYVHVRARRGQATDSHSLAERVRREKISERMKMLQGLVPGCEKVSGKAHMLDEIINYVQSLQNQVEFLSMRLASLSPVVYGFGLDISDYTSNNPPEKMMRRTPQAAMPTAEQRARLESTAFGNGTSTTNYHMMDHSAAPPYLLQGQVPTSSFDPQDAGSSIMQVGAGRQGFPNQTELVNITSLL